MKVNFISFFLFLSLCAVSCHSYSTSSSMDLSSYPVAELNSVDTIVGQIQKGVQTKPSKPIVTFLLKFLDNPWTDIFVGTIAGSIAFMDIYKDVSKVQNYQYLLLAISLHFLKALTSFLKEAKRALKGVAVV